MLVCSLLHYLKLPVIIYIFQLSVFNKGLKSSLVLKFNIVNIMWGVVRDV